MSYMFEMHDKGHIVNPIYARTCSSLFINRTEIYVQQALHGYLISLFITIEFWPSG